MTARIININGKLQPLPKTLPPVENTEAYTTSELNKLGFKVYEYAQPQIGPLQRQGDLIIKKGKATHEVVDIEVDINELVQQKKEEVREAGKLIIAEIQVLERLGKAVPPSLSDETLKKINDATISKIESFYTDGDFQGLIEYKVIDSPTVSGILNTLKNL